MRTKFIKGTNKQYSIREDGVVLRNYWFSKTRNKINDVKECLPQIRKTSIRYHININKKAFYYSSNKLLRTYFKFFFCTECEKKTKIKKEGERTTICETCIVKQQRETAKIWVKENPKLVQFYASLASKNCTRYYIAALLKIPLEDLSDILFEMKKAQLIFKREISQQLNINITKFSN